MKEEHPGDMIADLEEAAAIQEELAHQGLALEWGHTLCGKLARAWKTLETHEAFAYEDKVVLQVHLLDETTASLWHLHKAFAAKRRLLKRHLQDLRVQARGKSPALASVQLTSALSKAPHFPRHESRIS